MPELDGAFAVREYEVLVTSPTTGSPLAPPSHSSRPSHNAGPAPCRTAYGRGRASGLTSAGERCAVGRAGVWPTTAAAIRLQVVRWRRHPDLNRGIGCNWKILRSYHRPQRGAWAAVAADPQADGATRTSQGQELATIGTGGSPGSAQAFLAALGAASKAHFPARDASTGESGLLSEHLNSRRVRHRISKYSSSFWGDRTPTLGVPRLQ